MNSRYFCALYQRILAFKAGAGKPDVLVLMFHEVCPINEASDPEFSIDFSSFKLVIEKLKTMRKIVKLSDIDSYNCPIAAITFDDAYRNIFDEAIPYLINNDLPFELFVCNELVNKDGYIKKEQIYQIRESPLCSISFHSNHHIFVSGLKKAQFLDEISPALFENRFNVKCQCFAYPFGSVYASYTKHIKEAKRFYKFAFSTINSGFSVSYLKKHKYFLPRINVCNNSLFSVIKRFLIEKGSDDK